jgi:hypothetical protein
MRARLEKSGARAPRRRAPNDRSKPFGYLHFHEFILAHTTEIFLSNQQHSTDRQIAAEVYFSATSVFLCTHAPRIPARGQILDDLRSDSCDCSSCMERGFRSPIPTGKCCDHAPSFAVASGGKVARALRQSCRERDKRMATPAFFALTRSDLNPFLLAPIGEEHNGMTLSVFSGLARLDLDPWAEAERLAGLPGTRATEALALAIARMSGCWLPADARRIAERLVLLLPKAARGKSPGVTRPVRALRQAPSWLFWVLLGTLAIVTIMNFLP